MTKDKWFYISQFAIILLLLTLMDCIIRGPMEQIEKQTEHLYWLRQATSCEGLADLTLKVNNLDVEQIRIRERIGM